MIVLLSMVKNESAIIYRLLNSVKPYVDGIVICDTGSTDNTVKLVNDFLESTKIPGKVYSYPFVNFGVSRTTSFLKCREWVHEMGWDSRNTWALLLDGDMALDSPLEAPTDPSVAGVSLKQKNGSLIYTNIRLIRCSEAWVCKGATHEAWICPADKDVIINKTCILLDHNDGGSKADKFERDIRLLHEDLSENPLDTRTHFYLGQTYMALKDYTNAIKYLKRRIELGGWDEEVYVARVYLGECYEAEGNGAEAVYSWLAAWNSRQHRTEAAIYLIQHYRKQPNSQFIAWTFLEKLLNERRENADILFVNVRNLTHDIWEEFGILAFYLNKKEEARCKLDELDLTTRLSWWDSNNLLRHFRWYIKPTTPRQNVRIHIPFERLPWLDEEEAGKWQPFNPSLCKRASGYYLTLRYANYYTDDASVYTYRGTDGKVRTRNCLLSIEGSQWNNPVSIEEIKVGGFERKNSMVLGVEDCRFIQGSPNLEYLCTSISYSETGINTIFKLSRDEASLWTLYQMPLPPGVSDTEPQKNWLGFYHKGELLYVYSWSPYMVCDKSGAVRITHSYSGKYALNDYRGSANPVEWSSDAFPDEMYLCVIHKVQSSSDGRRYYHRFITLDKELKPSRVSCFLRLTSERIEYWSGLCFSIEKDSYWVSYGVKDSEAWLAEFKKGSIEESLLYSLG